MTDNAAQTTSGTTPRRRRSSSSSTTQSTAKAGQQQGVTDEVQSLFESARKLVDQHQANLDKLHEYDQSDVLDDKLLIVVNGLVKEQHKVAHDQRSKERAQVGREVSSFERRFGGFQPEPAPRQLDSVPADNLPEPPADTAPTSDVPSTPVDGKIDVAKFEEDRKHMPDGLALMLQGFTHDQSLAILATDTPSPTTDDAPPAQEDKTADTTSPDESTDKKVDDTPTAPAADKASNNVRTTHVLDVVKKFYDAAKGSPKASNTGSQTRS